MKVGIIGAGLIGNKRAEVALKTKDNIVIVADLDIEKAEKLSKNIKNCQTTNKWQDVIKNQQVEVVVVATTHDNLAPISLAALKEGKHVLCEKPLGINPKEVQKCVTLAEQKKLIYKAGYNHRFHPAVHKAKKLFEKKKIGKLMYIKGSYGHGGRPGYDKEWRVNVKKSGGGELIDQGAHLIDLACWFSKDNYKISSALTTAFWPIKPVEDNAFLILENNECVAFLHASWTEWKNRFTFEIYGSKGYLKISGLGGSYGQESLTLGIRIPGKAPKETIWEFENIDISWKNEWLNFKNAILKKYKIIASGKEGFETLKLIQKIYRKQ